MFCSDGFVNSADSTINYVEVRCDSETTHLWAPVYNGDYCVAEGTSGRPSPDNGSGDKRPADFCTKENAKQKEPLWKSVLIKRRNGDYGKEASLFAHVVCMNGAVAAQHPYLNYVQLICAYDRQSNAYSWIADDVCMHGCSLQNFEHYYPCIERPALDTNILLINHKVETVCVQSSYGHSKHRWDKPVTVTCLFSEEHKRPVLLIDIPQENSCYDCEKSTLK